MKKKILLIDSGQM